MKYLYIIVFFLYSSSVISSDLLTYLESAYKSNPQLNAERKNFKASEENISISRSQFLPSISLSGTKSSKQNLDRTDQSGNVLADTSNESESKEISIDQKIFQGFEGYNNFKKSKLELEYAKFKLLNVEQEILLKSASAYYDLIYRIKNKQFNKDNLDLFERQVESDRFRLQKGEITLTDLAQSESSLADAKAKFITSGTELSTSKTNFERIVRLAPPDNVSNSYELKSILPDNLSSALNLSKTNNPKLILAKLDFEISKKEVDIKKSDFSPSASVNYTQSKNKDFSSTVDDIDQETVKATVTWPLFKGGENYSSLKKVKFKKEQMNLILQDMSNEVKTDTTNAWSVFKSSASILQSTQAAVKAAEIANEGVTLEYDSGNQRTTLEVIQSRSLLLNARINNAKAERDFATSKFELLSVIGKLTLKDLKN